jgi:hypothetical protein
MVVGDPGDPGCASGDPGLCSESPSGILISHTVIGEHSARTTRSGQPAADACRGMGGCCVRTPLPLPCPDLPLTYSTPKAFQIKARGRAAHPGRRVVRHPRAVSFQRTPPGFHKGAGRPAIGEFAPETGPAPDGAPARDSTRGPRSGPSPRAQGDNHKGGERERGDHPDSIPDVGQSDNSRLGPSRHEVEYERHNRREDHDPPDREPGAGAGRAGVPSTSSRRPTPPSPAPPMPVTPPPSHPSNGHSGRPPRRLRRCA